MCHISNLNDKTKISEKRDLHPAYIKDFLEISGVSFKSEYMIPMQGTSHFAKSDFLLSYNKHRMLIELKVFNYRYRTTEHLTQLLGYLYRTPNIDLITMGTQTNITLIFVDENSDILNSLKPIFDANNHVPPSIFAKFHFTPISDFIHHDFEINKSFELKSVFEFINKHYEQ